MPMSQQVAASLRRLSEDETTGESCDWLLAGLYVLIDVLEAMTIVATYVKPQPTTQYGSLLLTQLGQFTGSKK